MTAPTPHTETIERELAALGEAPPSAEELALLEAGELDEIVDHAELASVARLVGLAEPINFDDLSELETHRGWRTVEQRLARARRVDDLADEPLADEPGLADEPDNDPRTDEPRPVGGGPQRWLFAAIGLAAAAAIAVIILRPSQPGLDPEQVVKMGEQARATLRVLQHGASDTQRAEQLAAEYQQRLEEQGG
jgi:hypothetical protein